MKIMIGGGFDDEDSTEKERLAVFVRCLAQQVIDRVISYVSNGGKAISNKGEVRDSANGDWNSMSGRRPKVPEPIEEADVVILLGGYTGTYTAANWARQSNTPVLPVASFGLAASEVLEDELSVSNVNERDSGLTDDDLKILKRSKETISDDSQKCIKYADEIVSLAERTIHSKDVFLIMSFSEETKLKEYLDAVKMSCEKVGFAAERMDKIPVGESFDIVEKIHEEIAACGFVIADLTNESPNVYYEVGYARGLGKTVLLTVHEDGNVHFDIAGLKHIKWDGHLSVREKLIPELEVIAQRFGIGAPKKVE